MRRVQAYLAGSAGTVSATRLQALGIAQDRVAGAGPAENVEEHTAVAAITGRMPAPRQPSVGAAAAVAIRWPPTDRSRARPVRRSDRG